MQGDSKRLGYLYLTPAALPLVPEFLGLCMSDLTPGVGSRGKED